METSLKDVLIDVAGVAVEAALEVGLLAVYVWCFQILWNNIVTDVLALRHLTYWQAMQILVLTDVCVSFSRRLNKDRSKS